MAAIQLVQVSGPALTIKQVSTSACPSFDCQAVSSRQTVCGTLQLLSCFRLLCLLDRGLLWWMFKSISQHSYTLSSFFIIFLYEHLMDDFITQHLAFPSLIVGVSLQHSVYWAFWFRHWSRQFCGVFGIRDCLSSHPFSGI